MVEPSGPLPQSVYWRRRVVAAVGSVLAVLLLAWVIGRLVESDDQHPVHGATSASELGGAVVPSGVRTTSRRAAAPSPVPEEPMSEVPRPAASPVPTTAPPPVPPAACPDAVTKVVAAPEVPSYRVGALPLLKLRVVNAGPVPCTRDVSRTLREILLLGADGARLWSSNDCYKPPAQDVRVLPPNQPVEFSVKWAGRTSAPGCPLERKPVPAGTYQVVGKLGPLAGAPTQLVLT
ncbi:MAG: hypothetical protein WBA97_30010 [Actinophytocola sp.]|uniref:hypothetical protein n=1 Tax=Actinophytocola sp. TaxID=1872138 RepID=UPI003C7837FA